jgi:hypothetical protein
MAAAMVFCHPLRPPFVNRERDKQDVRDRCDSGRSNFRGVLLFSPVSRVSPKSRDTFANKRSAQWPGLKNRKRLSLNLQSDPRFRKGCGSSVTTAEKSSIAKKSSVIIRSARSATTISRFLSWSALHFWSTSERSKSGMRSLAPRTR